MSVPKRFAILRFFGSLLKVLAWIFLVLSIIGSIGAVLAGTAMTPFFSQWGISGAEFLSAGGGIIAGIVTLVLGLFYFVLFYALGRIRSTNAGCGREYAVDCCTASAHAPG